MHQYEERYVAFIDILAFRPLVNRAEEDAKLLERLASVLEEQESLFFRERYLGLPIAAERP